jgi:hypothetical protein
MTKRIFAAVLLLCLFVSVVYAQSAATVFGWPPADGSVTNAKLAEPVSVANGGTGKTTAAEALAALGGASLNGSSTVAFNASTLNGVAPLTAAEKTQALMGSYLTTTSTVVISTTSGEIDSTSATCTYTLNGKLLYVNYEVTITDPGTADGGMLLKLPDNHTAANIGIFAARESTMTGILGVCNSSAGHQYLQLFKADNTTPFTINYRWVVTGWVEVQ